MATRPSIAVKRPNRSTDAISTTPTPIEPTAIPTIDPESSYAIAFSMRGRGSATDDMGDRRVAVATASTKPSSSPADPRDAIKIPSEGQLALSYANVSGAEPNVDGERGQELISIKLHPDVGRQLAAIADRRGSKRTLIAIEALSEPLRTLAAAHRAGDFPDLPKIVSGTVRSSIAFALPPELAADLEFVLKARRAVRAQVVTRLLTPAVRALYDCEVGQRNR